MTTRPLPEGSVTDYTTPAGARRYRLVIDGPPGLDGKRRQIKREGFKKKGEAREALAVLRRDLYEGKVPTPDASSTEAIAGAWLAALGAEGLEPSTVVHYRECVNRMLPTSGRSAYRIWTPTTWTRRTPRYGTAGCRPGASGPVTSP